MDSVATRELQFKLLEIMKVFHNVCEKHGIKYFMLGGTMLGAVRHKGFIPWDDDMDVGIPRKDYEKLLKLPKSEWPQNIVFKTPYNSSDLIFPYSKIMDLNTTLVEDRLDGIVEGIYIDIFPLDGAGNSFKHAKLRYWGFYWKQGLLFNNQDHGDKKTILRRLVQRYARGRDVKKLYKSLEKWMKRINYDKSSIIGNYAGAWGFKEFMYKNVMESPILYEFEDLKLYGSNDAHSYLNSLYGDYMKLPSLEKRKSHHNFKYINLSQPLEEYRTFNKSNRNKGFEEEK